MSTGIIKSIGWLYVLQRCCSGKYIIIIITSYTLIYVFIPCFYTLSLHVNER